LAKPVILEIILSVLKRITELLGVVPMHKQNKLNEKYDFPFPLLADEDKSVKLSAFGDLKFMGKDTMEFTELLLSSMNYRCEVITRVNSCRPDF
jgi:peroxiredoxin Q/BCP